MNSFRRSLRLGLAVAAVALFAGTAGATPVISAGSNLTYSGTEGPFNNAGTLNAVPANLALNPTNLPAGPTAFTNGVIAGGSLPVHQTRHLNDGNYGNSRSWIGEAPVSVNLGGAFGTVTADIAGIDLKGSHLLTSFAFGSDNGNFLSANGAPFDGNENAAGADTGFYHDRTGGTYGVQYTTSATPATAPDSAWNLFAGITLADGSNDAFRHLYNITAPVTATGLRFVLPDGDRIDEIEIYGTPVPEPTSLSLIGLGVLALLRRRRNA